MPSRLSPRCSGLILSRHMSRVSIGGPRTVPVWITRCATRESVAAAGHSLPLTHWLTANASSQEALEWCCRQRTWSTAITWPTHAKEPKIWMPPGSTLKTLVLTRSHASRRLPAMVLKVSERHARVPVRTVLTRTIARRSHLSRICSQLRTSSRHLRTVQCR